jgi:membrane-associated phospholipid phosphatase
MSRMRWRTFLFYNALGGAVCAPAAVSVGYFLGTSLGLVERWTGRATALLGGLLVAALLLYLSYRWVAKHPELIGRAFDRLGTERLRAFLRSPAGRWLGRRFSPRGAFGLVLTVGIALTGLFSWAFGGVVEDVLTRDPLVRVDVAVLRYLHSHAEPYLTLSAGVLEAVFSPEALLSATALAGCALAVVAHRRKDFRLGFSGAVLLAIALGTGALAEFFKILFHRPRPPASLRLVHETGNGFPSAHAVAIVAVGAAVWYLWSIRPEGAWGGSWRAKARVGLAVVVLALLVGIGRVYEGAHYPSDVLAGWALGGVWASVCLTAAEVFRRLYGNGSMGFSGGRAKPPTGRPSERRQDAERPIRGRWTGTFEYGARGSGRSNPALGGG